MRQLELPVASAGVDSDSLFGEGTSQACYSHLWRLRLVAVISSRIRRISAPQTFLNPLVNRFCPSAGTQTDVHPSSFIKQNMRTARCQTLPQCPTSGQTRTQNTFSGAWCESHCRVKAVDVGIVIVVSPYDFSSAIHS